MYSPMVVFRRTTTALVLAALLVAILPFRVSAFMPSQDATISTHAQGSATHESITHDVIEDYDKTLFGLRARNKPLTQSMQGAMQEIIDSDIDVDNFLKPQWTNAPSHFDGEAFQLSQQRLIDYKLRVKNYVDPPSGIFFKGKPDIPRARYYLGQALHTLQDFYAHSNWVEMGNTNPYAILGVPGNPLVDPPATTKTCTDCARDHCTDCYDPATNLTNLISPQTLTTGYYGSDANRPKPNDFKCSHGGKVSVFLGPLNIYDTVDGKGAFGNGINKDTKVCRISPHNDRHVDAAEMAKKATKLYLDDLKTRLGVRKMKVLLGGGPTVAVAIDTTGSMTGAIAQAKDQIIQMIDSRIGTDDEPGQYVLSPFNDPSLGPVTVTDDPNEFKQAVRGLSAFGGGDCPEFAMTGMLQALQVMQEGDELLMFTDASSKDGFLASAVESEALTRGVTITPVSFGSCSPIDPGYIRLANNTGGQLFQLGQSETANVIKFADLNIRSNTVDLLHVVESINSQKTYSVPVDSTVTRVNFAVSGTGSLVVTRPGGAVVQPSDADATFISLTGGKIVSVGSPTPGAWNATVGGPADMSLRVSGESSLGFSFQLVELSSTGSHPGYFPRIGFPIANQTSSVTAHISPEAATVNLDLRDFAGTTLQQIAATEVGWANDDPAEESFTTGPVRLFNGEISTPSLSFRAYATGQDANGFPYQRVVLASSRAQTVKVTPPPAQELVPGQTTQYTFTVTNLGLPDTFNLRAVDNQGFVSGVSPASLTLATNESLDVTVNLSPAANIANGGLNSLTLWAESTGSPEAFNYATVESNIRSTFNLVFDNFTANEAGGDGDNVIEAGESGSIAVQLDNVGDATVTGIEATLASNTPGVTINTGTSAFPDTGPSDVAVNAVPFTFTLAGNVPFETSVDFILSVNYAGAAQPLVLKLTVPVGGLTPAQIAFTTFRDGDQEVYRIASDGAGLTNMTHDPGDDSSPVASPDQRKLAFITRRSGLPRIYVMNANGGNASPVTTNTNDLAYASAYAWSPDGTRLTFARFDNFVPQISVINIDGSNLMTLTNSDGDKDGPAWSPDGTRIAFTRKGEFNNLIQRYNTDIYVMNADGTNQTQLTTGLTASELTWSPDGSTIAFVTVGPRNSTFERNTSELRVINSDGSNLRQFTTNSISKNPTWSPDGTKIAFSSNRTNLSNFDLFLINADGSNQVNLINDLRGGFQSGFPPDDEKPAWSPDGTRIAFTRSGTELHLIKHDGTGNVMIVASQFSVRFPTWIRPDSSGPPTSPIPSVLIADSQVIAAGSSAALTATLKDNSGGAISGRSVTLTLGAGADAQSCSALTNSNGVATCTIGNVAQPLGPGTLSAEFAGDANYLPSSGAAETLIFSYASANGAQSFVIGGVNAAVGNSIKFWGSQWSASNPLSNGSAPSSFKGFANQVNFSPDTCGGQWTSRPGNSSGPPSAVPAYMAVLVSSSVNKSGSTTSGNIVRMVIVRTDPGYSGNPGHVGTGTVVGILCHP